MTKDNTVVAGAGPVGPPWWAPLFSNAVATPTSEAISEGLYVMMWGNCWLPRGPLEGGLLRAGSAPALNVAPCCCDQEGLNLAGRLLLALQCLDHSLADWAPFGLAPSHSEGRRRKHADRAAPGCLGTCSPRRPKVTGELGALGLGKGEGKATYSWLHAAGISA